MILGGGIAGLYTAYTLLRENPDRQLLLIEATDRLGGRVHTYTDKYMSVEAGAGRFSDSHPLFMQLLHDLHLESKIVPITSESTYTERTPYSLKLVVGKVVVASKLDFYHDLTKLSFLDYARLILSPEEVEFIEDAYGYYSEFVLMNARDAIKLMLQLNQNFFVLKGGLQQVIDALVTRLRMFPNFTLHTNERVISISRRRGLYSVHTTRATYSTDTCVCALPKEALMALDISKPFRPLLARIECGPLCRIYCTFKKRWWTPTKYTTPNPIRIIIPYSKDTIMISYSDNKYAMFWRDVHKEGDDAVIQALQYYVKESLGIQMPRPTKLKVFYWECGVGYWGVGVNSTTTAKRLCEPLPRFHLCGEHYSANHQQWMEGALETARAASSRVQDQ